MDPGSQVAHLGKMGAGCPPLTGHCSGRVLRDARTGVRLLTCSVPVGGSAIGTPEAVPRHATAEACRLGQSR